MACPERVAAVRWVSIYCWDLGVPNLLDIHKQEGSPAKLVRQKYTLRAHQSAFFSASSDTRCWSPSHLAVLGGVSDLKPRTVICMNALKDLA